MDTAKAANLWVTHSIFLVTVSKNLLPATRFTVYKDADLMDFINAPIGKGLPIAQQLRPLICGKWISPELWSSCFLFNYTPVPTTAGTGSETTGTAILDITSKSFKTGIASRALKPTLGIVDTRNTETCPTEVHISSGLDVLFHSLESYTAIPSVASESLYEMCHLIWFTA